MKQSTLRALGLSEKEMTLYNLILEQHALTPVELSKKSGVKRTTAYSIARSLVEKGLLNEDATRRPRVFVPSSPTEILGVIAEEKKRIGEKEKVAKELIKELVQRKADHFYTIPKIRFIEEEKMEKFLYQETPKWHRALENLSEPLWWGFQDSTFVAQFPDWITWQWENAPESVCLNMLTNKSDIEKKIAKKYPKRSMKFWDDGVRFTSSMWAIEEYIVIINTQRHPFYLYEVHDPLLSNDLREMLKSVWRTK